MAQAEAGLDAANDNKAIANRIAGFFQEFQVAMGVARFTFGGGTENGGDVVVTFDVRFLCEVQVTTVCLGFTRKRSFQVFFGFAAFQLHCFFSCSSTAQGRRHF